MTDLPDAVEEEFTPLSKFAADRLEAFGRILIVLVLDALLIIGWFAIRLAIQWVADIVQRHGVHAKCVFLLEDLGPWVIFVIAILHLAADLVDELGYFWRNVRPRKKGQP